MIEETFSDPEDLIKSKGQRLLMAVLCELVSEPYSFSIDDLENLFSLYKQQYGEQKITQV